MHLPQLVCMCFCNVAETEREFPNRVTGLVELWRWSDVLRSRELPQHKHSTALELGVSWTDTTVTALPQPSTHRDQG